MSVIFVLICVLFVIFCFCLFWVFLFNYFDLGRDPMISYGKFYKYFGEIKICFLKFLFIKIYIIYYIYCIIYIVLYIL